MSQPMTVAQTIWQWLDTVVIGLNLCPFAKKPRVNQQIKLTVCEARKDKAVLSQLLQELQYLDQTPAEQTDTIMFVLANHAYDFYDYLDLLDKAQIGLINHGYEGKYQLASFHPDYVFDGTPDNARENYTNRAPYPIIHVLREDTLERAIDKYPNPDRIPELNIATLNDLDDSTFETLFDK